VNCQKEPASSGAFKDVSQFRLENNQERDCQQTDQSFENPDGSCHPKKKCNEEKNREIKNPEEKLRCPGALENKNDLVENGCQDENIQDVD
jgi:hypothetical protein